MTETNERTSHAAVRGDRVFCGQVEGGNGQFLLLLYITYSVNNSVRSLGSLDITGLAGLSENIVETKLR